MHLQTVLEACIIGFVVGTAAGILLLLVMSRTLDKQFEKTLLEHLKENKQI